MSLPETSLVLLCSVLAVPGIAQKVSAQRARPPALAKPPVPDPGVPVEMFESANLDTFLRVAQDNLGDEDYGVAIQLLQDVIEGRTGEFMDPAAKPAKGADAKGKTKGKTKGKGKAKKPSPADALPIDDDNPAYSVFSSDDRIYRPVARLCHELLASMPPEGIGLYRDKYEAIAKAQYEAAIAKSDLSALEAVHNQYFATLHAAYAMQAAVDLLMDAGRFRAAIQTLDTLLETYPDTSRREAGIRDLVLMAKVAVCFQQLDEFELAREQLDRMTAAFPEASVRLMGELHTVKDLPANELFKSRDKSVDQGARSEHKRAGFTLDLAQASHLVPLWEYRHTDTRPYRSTKSSTRSRNRGFIMGRGRGAAVRATQYPKHRDDAPGTTVTFSADGLIFLDHFRPVVHDPISGRQRLAMGDPGLATTHVPANNHAPRIRTPAYDYFASRVAMDARRFYVIEGCNKSYTASKPFRSLHENKIVAYDRTTGALAWQIDSREGLSLKRSLTFLATPTVYRNTLLLPFLDAGSYGLLCLAAEDGQEIYRTYLHYGGTGFARAPTPQIVVNAGIAYALTNAGVLGAVDANTGVLSWSRKYERVHPKRGKFKARRRTRRAGFGRVMPQPTNRGFQGFAPTDLHVIGDLLIVAAVDSKVLSCVNGATGEILWRHNAEEDYFQHAVLHAQLKHIVGHNRDFLFVQVGESQLLCVGLRSGLRYWVADIPGDSREWAGRGCVTDDYVVLPGGDARQIHVIAANTRKLPKFKTLRLPDFSIGKAPLSGPANLFVHGAFVAACYEGGVELYSSADALASLAEQTTAPLERVSYLVHAGRLEDAVKILLQQLDRADLEAVDRRKIAVRALSLVDEVSALLATNGRREEALGILDRCEKRMPDSRLIRRVHLFRLQIFRTLGDLSGIEREQEFIESGGIK